MNRPQRIVLTGATGFIGHYLLAALLRRGHTCVVLARGPLARTRARLMRLLGDLGLDADALVCDARLVYRQGDLCAGLPHPDDLQGSVLVHAAGATNFYPDGAGNPQRTNVLGTHNILAFAESAGITEVHLLSTAYVCGRARGPVPEAVMDPEPTFHNDYERSKYDSERMCEDWAASTGSRLTICRPSVVVGDFASGRATRFNGFYVLARATEFLHRSLGDADARARHAVDLRIKARATDRQNFVPVDYVAAMMAHIIDDPTRHGQVYHLTHPCPPTNAEIKSWLESYFDLGGGRFVDPAAFPADGLSEHERIFADVIRPIEHHFTDTPSFQRANAEAVERAAGISCPRYEAPAIARLVGHAQSVRWGRRLPPPDPKRSACAAYFEHFLPQRVGLSTIARVSALTTALRFVIEDEPDGEWVCAFDAGRLTSVTRGRNGIREDFAYRTSRAVFWDAISGRVHPQELFLSGRADITGDVDKGLKMAMLLHEFTREFPCDRKTLAAYGVD